MIESKPKWERSSFLLEHFLVPLFRHKRSTHTQSWSIKLRLKITIWLFEFTKSQRKQHRMSQIEFAIKHLPRLHLISSTEVSAKILLGVPARITFLNLLFLLPFSQKDQFFSVSENWNYDTMNIFYLTSYKLKNLRN